MEETTSRVTGFPEVTDWSLGSQWIAYFPYSLLRLELQPQSAVSLIVDKERIKLKSGTYDTWKISQSPAQQAGYVLYTVLNSIPTDNASSSDYWYFDPTIVFPVKAEISYTNGAKWSLSLNNFEAGKTAASTSASADNKKQP